MSIGFGQIFDEPTAVDASTPPKKFKVAPTFVIDLTISLVCILTIAPTWKASFQLGLIVNLPTFAIGALILLCYAGKVLVISHLSRQGGDARTYVKSAALVTDGPYAFSRHPTYLVAMIQFLLWSALALYLQVFMPGTHRCSPPQSASRRLLAHQRSRRDADRGSDAAASARWRVRRLREPGAPLVRTAGLMSSSRTRGSRTPRHYRRWRLAPLPGAAASCPAGFPLSRE